jgi:hypothetical protein
MSLEKKETKIVEPAKNNKIIQKIKIKRFMYFTIPFAHLFFASFLYNLKFYFVYYYSLLSLKRMRKKIE